MRQISMNITLKTFEEVTHHYVKSLLEYKIIIMNINIYQELEIKKITQNDVVLYLYHAINM